MPLYYLSLTVIATMSLILAAKPLWVLYMWRRWKKESILHQARTQSAAMNERQDVEGMKESKDNVIVPEHE